jgi:hypothetical protein
MGRRLAVSRSSTLTLPGLSADLLLALIGVAHLLVIANNGTVDLIVSSAVKAVGAGPLSFPG